MRSGYRAQMTARECLASMFRWHNQTMNIWTSVALVFFNLWLAARAAAGRGDGAAAMFWFQGLTRALCWFNSWAYHTFVPHSPRVAHAACQLDYAGCFLTPLGMGSNLLFIELRGHVGYRAAFLCAGGATVGLAVAASLLPRYQSEAYRPVRALLSLASALPYLAGLAVAVAVAHRGSVPGYYRLLAYGVLCEALAGTFYLSMFPEKYFAETFDCLLPSHSLWHWLNFGFDACMMALAVEAARAD